MSDGEAAPAIATESTHDAGGLGDGAEPERPIAPKNPTANDTAPEPEAPKQEETPEYKHFAALKERETKQRRAEMKFRAEQEAFSKRQAEVEARAKEAEKRLEEAQAKLADFQLLKDDPLAWAEKYDADPSQLVEKFVTPVSKEERRIRALEQRIEELVNGHKKASEEEQRSKTTQTYTSEVHSFIGGLEPSQFPHVFSYYEGPEEVRAGMEAVYKSEAAAFREEYGREPTDLELVATLESLAKARITKAQEKARQYFSPPATEATNNGSRNGSATLNNLDASEISSAAKPKSRQERAASLVARLQAELPDRD